MASTLPNSSSEPAHGGRLTAATAPLLAAASATAPLACAHLHFRHRLAVAAAHGQAVADAALDEAERRIAGLLRPGDHLLRSAQGDFFLLLPRLLGLGHAELAVQRIVREFETPLDIEGRLLFLGPTLGLALATDPAEAPEALQRRASSAVLEALRTGLPHALAHDLAHAAIAAELREALARNALELVYQPIVTLPERQVVGYEALARWRRMEGDSVAPSVFIPMAEDAGLAAELTRWTLQVALREFAPLHARQPGSYCAVNLSARAFEDPALGEQVLSALAIWGLPPEALMVEVTETAVLHDVGRNAGALARLAAAGVRLAIDDFGQGYSSLGYLRHLPAAVLKIDQGFVADATTPRTRALLEAITRMAHRLGMRVVAEGVEDEAMLGAVLEAGCDFAQGFLFARPAPLGHWLEKVLPA